MIINEKILWKKEWLKAFNTIDNKNRLSRGRTYANNNAVKQINISDNGIQAQVKGSRSKPYKVSLQLTQFTQEQKKNIHGLITTHPHILQNIKLGILPITLYSLLAQNKILLFPKSFHDFVAHCDCPDAVVPCKHIAALIYVIADEIEKNPLIIFTMQGYDLLTIHTNKGSSFSSESISNIFQFSSITRPYTSQNDYSIEQKLEILHNLSFSKIPNLKNQTLTLLKQNPLPDSYHDAEILLEKIYGKMARYSTPKIVPSSFFSDRKTSQSQEEHNNQLLKFTHSPQTWKSLGVTVGSDGKLFITKKRDTKEFYYSGCSIYELFMINELLPDVLIQTLSYDVQFIEKLLCFTQHLAKKGAIIPRLVKLSDHKSYVMQWIPALYDSTVHTIFNQLVTLCPINFIQYNKQNVHPEEQIKMLISYIAEYITHHWLEKIEKNSYTKASLRKVLEQKPFIDDDYRRVDNISTLINDWFKPLHQKIHNYSLHLFVEEETEKMVLQTKIYITATRKYFIPKPQSMIEFDTTIKPEITDDIIIVQSLITNYKFTSIFDPITLTTEELAIFLTKTAVTLKEIGITLFLPKSLEDVLNVSMNLSLKTPKTIKNDRQTFLNLDKLLDFEWKVALGKNTISAKEFKKIKVYAGGLIYLKNEYMIINPSELDALTKKINATPEQLSRFDIMQAAILEEFQGNEVTLDIPLKNLFKKQNELPKIIAPKNLKATLRPYQQRGFEWLTQNIHTAFGSILADDMGLGKTIQVITTILHLKNEKYLKDKKILIIGPTSLLTNWAKEIEKFAPSLTSSIYHGIARELKNIEKIDIIITSYGVVRGDYEKLNQYSWFLVIIDEAQNIKNPTTAQTKAVKTLKAENRIALTGTPVENRLLEYWSIFDFTNPSYLGTHRQFQQEFAAPIEKDRNTDTLKKFTKLTNPFILRRLKSDKNIIADLPDKIENNKYCDLTAEQAAIYQKIVDISIQEIENSAGISRKGLILKLLTNLKQVCNHPANFAQIKTPTISQSGKMEMLEEIISEIQQTDEKVIIFTQYGEMGNLISELLGSHFNMTIPFLHGSLSRKERDKIVDNFQNHTGHTILIISLKAGGTGLNLTGANHVIHYDLWWNPAVESQATDRAYRIGQKNNVMVYRFICANTFEEEIDKMLQHKKELTNLTLNSQETWITEMTTSQLKELVKIRKVL